MMKPATSALILGDLQNDFLHPDGAYGRAKQSHPSIAALPEKLGPLVRAARQRGVLIVATLFTLVPGRGGEPIISPHLAALRPFLGKGDFAPGGWGQQQSPVATVARQAAAGDVRLGAVGELHGDARRVTVHVEQAGAAGGRRSGLGLVLGHRAPGRSEPAGYEQ